MFCQTRSNVIRLSSSPALTNDGQVAVRKGDIFHVPEQSFYLVHSGAIHLETMRSNAGTVQNRKVGILLPGDPVGVLEKYTSDARFYYRAIEDCVLQTLTDDFSRETEGNYLIVQIFKALSQVALRLIFLHSAPDDFRGYPRIRALIYRYMEMKRCGELKEEKLIPFVLSHTSLPEAQVTSVLTSLTERAYLDIRRGKLNAINFPLPPEYQEQETLTMTDLHFTDPFFRMMG
jgi:CRP-like cAMP-binding protein